MQQPIFGISGLRGVVGRDLLPETVAQAAAIFGAGISPGPVALGRDARLSSEMFALAAAAGLASAGCEVIQLDICATPTVAHYVRAGQVAGGVVVTASHNPERYNGLKFIGKGGVSLSVAQAAELKQLFLADEARRVSWKDIRLCRRDRNAVMLHVNAITGNELFSGIREKLSLRRMRIGIDAVNGAASQAAVLLVQALGAVPVELYCRTDDETVRKGFPRKPEPTAESLADLCRIVRQANLDAGIAFDPDGDRFSCVDETGTALGEEATILLACRYILPRRKGTVVVNLSTTRAVEDVCSAFGVPVERTPVGEACVVQRMQECNATLGGEGNGGVILPEVNFTRDGLVAAAIVLGLIADTGRKLSEIRAELPEYHRFKTKVEAGRRDFSVLTEKLLRTFPDWQTNRDDGIKLESAEGWVHVRPSNTEPIVRIVGEARTPEQAEALERRCLQALKD